MRRRELLQTIGASAAGLLALAGCNAVPVSTPRKPPLIGYLTNVRAADSDATIDGFRQGLREQGLIDGENLRIEWRFGEGDNTVMPALTSELLNLDVKLIVASGGAPAFVREATRTVPIVAFGGAGLVERGEVESLSRPGGNLTGIQFPNELGAKALEILREVLPSARRVAYMANLAVSPVTTRTVTALADRLQLELLIQDIQSQAELEPAFERAVAWGAELLLPNNVVPLNSPRALLPSLARRFRLPAGSADIRWTEAGLPLAYSGSLWHVAHRAAFYVARILNGADPAVMPVELATVYDLAVNRPTLEYLGLALPSHVAAQVTRWIA